MDPRQINGAFSWMEWQTGEAAADVEATRDFYASVFGWSKLDMPMQDGSSYAAVTLGEAPMGGFVAKGGGSGRGAQWLPYITVDDVDGRIEAVAQGGGSVEVEPFDAPGVGRIAIVRDPSGASVALIRYPEAAAS